MEAAIAGIKQAIANIDAALKVGPFSSRFWSRFRRVSCHGVS